jgi:ABC-2 type transport system ATP-binding protein
MILETKDLSFGFRKDTPIVKNLNLQVEKGAVYGFLGPNGAGKTTTIRLLLGLLKPEKPCIHIFGKSLEEHQLEIFAKTGALIETPSLYEHLSGADNLAITCKLKNVSKSRIPVVLEQVRLSHAANMRAKRYSLGMKQRLGLAIALLSEPELLILDEPVNGLDPNGMIETRELLLKLNQETGTTIFISSHLLAEIEKMVTHLGIIAKGNMIFQGTIKELQALKQNQATLQIQTNNNDKARQILQEKYKINFTEAGDLQMNFENREQAAFVNKVLVNSELDVYQLRVVNQDLEQIFLEITG